MKSFVLAVPDDLYRKIEEIEKLPAYQQFSFTERVRMILANALSGVEIGKPNEHDSMPECQFHKIQTPEAATDAGNDDAGKKGQTPEETFQIMLTINNFRSLRYSLTNLSVKDALELSRLLKWDDEPSEKATAVQGLAGVGQIIDRLTWVIDYLTPMIDC